MFLARALILSILIALAVNASAATKAIKFGNLWDGHKIVNKAVVVVENDKIISVRRMGAFLQAQKWSI